MERGFWYNSIIVYWCNGGEFWEGEFWEGEFWEGVLRENREYKIENKWGGASRENRL